MAELSCIKLAKHFEAEGVVFDLSNLISTFVGISSGCSQKFVIEASNASLLAVNLVKK